MYELYGLFRVVNYAALTNNVDLDLTGIFHFSFNLLGNLTCHKYHVSIRYLLGHNHYTNFTTCLNSKRFIYTFEIVCYFF